MESFLERTAEGRANRWTRWYALAHAARCSGCAAFLRRLEATMIALRVARDASSDEENLARLRGLIHELGKKGPKESDPPSEA